MLPLDLIPDFISVLEQLDVVIIPILVYKALMFIQPEIIDQCQVQVTLAASQTQNPQA